MSVECDKCGEHCLDCKCTERKIVFAKREPLTDEIILNELEKAFVRLRDIKAYVKEQKERMEAIYPNETQGYLVINYLYKNLLGFVNEEDEISYDDLPRPRF